MQREEYTTASIWGLNVRHVEVGEGTKVALPHDLADYHLSWHCNIGELTGAEYRVIRKLSLLDNSVGDLISGLYTLEHPSSVEENIIISVAQNKSACRAGTNCILQAVPKCGNWPPMIIDFLDERPIKLEQPAS